MNSTEFQQVVLDYFSEHGRDLPWRHTEDPYHILVSELMLQQTQVDRVVPKYITFLTTFPTVNELAGASTNKVLGLWQGLGYNRRALFLQRCAQTVLHDYNGVFPNSREELQKLPGIGSYTSAALSAFAFNQPVIMIETNIRRVFLHHFFEDRAGVDDKELLPLIELYMYQENPRVWYSALMDYGTHLAKTIPNPNRRSKHYTKQSKFEGSKRQLRGELIRLYLDKGVRTLQEAQQYLQESPERVAECLQDLKKKDL